MQLGVVWGDLTAVQADVHLVGHYQDVLPSAAEGALDRAISGDSTGVIAEYTRRRGIEGRLGELIFFPSAHEVVKTAGLAGMGSPGTFNERLAIRLYGSVLSSLALHPGVSRIATVLIGSGAGSLSIDRAVEALVMGVGAFMGRSDPQAIREIVVVEIDRLRAELILAALQEAVERHDLDHLEVDPKITEGDRGKVSEASAAVYAIQALAASVSATADGGALGDLLGTLGENVRSKIVSSLGNLAGAPIGALRVHLGRSPENFGTMAGQAADANGERSVRLSILGSGAGFKWAAITDRATVPERYQPKSSLFDDLADRLNAPPDDVTQLQALLTQLVVPPDFRALLCAGAPLVVEVDRTTASMHWEFVADLDADPAEAPMAVRTPVARQLKTGYAPVLFKSGVPGETRVLVIGDPGSGAHSLEGARREAEEVCALLDKLGVLSKAYIGSRSNRHKKFPPATLLDVVGELLTGSYSVVHYCGHGMFDPFDPVNRAGWQFEEGLLTSQELRAVTKPPSLVLANCCESALFSNRDESPPAGGARTNRSPADLGPSLADEFLRCGVAHYIGSAWKIGDAAAAAFASAFYTALLSSGQNVGSAVQAGRKAIWDQRRKWKVDWAAYQHYGDPSDHVHRPASDRSGKRSRIGHGSAAPNGGSASGSTQPVSSPLGSR